jgi:hypothetical protein
MENPKLYGYDIKDKYSKIVKIRRIIFFNVKTLKWVFSKYFVYFTKSSTYFIRNFKLRIILYNDGGFKVNINFFCVYDTRKDKTVIQNKAINKMHVYVKSTPN